jgi:hypothetical protein
MEKLIKTPKRVKKDYSNVAKRYRDGARIVDLAKEFGISRPGMYLRLKEEGITEFRDDRKKVNEPEAIAMYNQGFTMTTIARKYGCTVSAVSMIMKKHGVTSRHRAVTPDLEKIDLGIPEIVSDTKAAFKEFQKDLGRQKANSGLEVFEGLDDDEDNTDYIKALLGI